PSAVFVPGAEVIEGAGTLGQIIRNQGPLATDFVDIEDGVEYQTHVDRAWRAAMLGRWNQGFDQRPLFIRNIRCISLVHRSPILEPEKSSKNLPQNGLRQDQL